MASESQNSERVEASLEERLQNRPQRILVMESSNPQSAYAQQMDEAIALLNDIVDSNDGGSRVTIETTPSGVGTLDAWNAAGMEASIVFYDSEDLEARETQSIKYQLDEISYTYFAELLDGGVLLDKEELTKTVVDYLQHTSDNLQRAQQNGQINEEYGFSDEETANQKEKLNELIRRSSVLYRSEDLEEEGILFLVENEEFIDEDTLAGGTYHVYRKNGTQQPPRVLIYSPNDAWATYALKRFAETMNVNAVSTSSLRTAGQLAAGENAFGLDAIVVLADDAVAARRARRTLSERTFDLIPRFVGSTGAQFNASEYSHYFRGRDLFSDENIRSLTQSIANTPAEAARRRRSLSETWSRINVEEGQRKLPDDYAPWIRALVDQGVRLISDSGLGASATVDPDIDYGIGRRGLIAQRKRAPLVRNPNAIEVDGKRVASPFDDIELSDDDFQLAEPQLYYPVSANGSSAEYFLLSELILAPTTGSLMMMLNEAGHEDVAKAIAAENVAFMETWRNRVSARVTRSEANEILTRYEQNSIGAYRGNDPGVFASAISGLFTSALPRSLTAAQISDIFGRKFDNSTWNSGIELGILNPTIDQVLEVLTSNGKPDVDAIRKSTYFWDQSYEGALGIEDVAHFIDSYEAALPAEERTELFGEYMGGLPFLAVPKKNLIPLMVLGGFYRNWRKADLEDGKFQVNEEDNERRWQTPFLPPAQRGMSIQQRYAEKRATNLLRAEEYARAAVALDVGNANSYAAAMRIFEDAIANPFDLDAYEGKANESLLYVAKEAVLAREETEALIEELTR